MDVAAASVHHGNNLMQFAFTVTRNISGHVTKTAKYGLIASVGLRGQSRQAAASRRE